MQDRAPPASMHSARGRRHTAEEKKRTTGIDAGRRSMQIQDTKQITAAACGKTEDTKHRLLCQPAKMAAVYREIGGARMDVLLDRDQKTEADEIIKFVKSLTTNERYEFIGIIRGVQMARRAEPDKEKK